MRFMTGLFLILSAFLLPNTAFAEAAAHKVTIHVDQNDPQVMNMALNNAKNLSAYYTAKGETVDIELVAYGPGVMMLREDKSPVKDRISAMALEMPNMVFSACNNTIQAMTKKEGQEIKILGEAGIVPSGVVRLIELQEQGYAYVRP